MFLSKLSTKNNSVRKRDYWPQESHNKSKSKSIIAGFYTLLVQDLREDDEREIPHLQK